MSSATPTTTPATSHPLSLSGLTTREQIADCILRACLALDSNDLPLWESAWSSHPDISMDVNGRLIQGKEALHRDGFGVAGPLDTQHLVTGLRVDVQEGASTARVTANGLHQHFRAGEGMKLGAAHLLAGSLYDVEVVKEDSGEWRMKTWRLKIRWVQGDWAVMQPQATKQESAVKA